MFDVSFPELVVIAIVALLILGPERLPEALRTAGLWLGRLRRNFVAMKTEIEKEIGMDDVRRQLHNESIMHDLKRIEREVRGTPPGQPPADHTTVPATASIPAPAPAPEKSDPGSDTDHDRAPQATRQG